MLANQIKAWKTMAGLILCIGVPIRQGHTRTSIVQCVWQDIGSAGLEYQLTIARHQGGPP